MFVEAPILDRQHRLLHPLWDRGQRDGAALLALAAIQGGEHWRIEHQPLARFRAELEPLHAVGRLRRRLPARGVLHFWRRPLEDDADDLPFQFGRARHDRDRAVADGELARFLDMVAMRIAEIVEAVDQLALGERLAPAQLERTREDPWKHRLAFAVQPRINEMREADIGI